ncbi:hypothetical protein [Spirillospora sp. NPDC048824]|uniref:hypothetical protein n=1 Tax=Spirillospora sp. NPDC048824 TaxID=3364526 RepID=UPI00371A5B60
MTRMSAARTVIAEEFGGRGLEGLLVREALADSIRKEQGHPRGVGRGARPRRR